MQTLRGKETMTAKERVRRTFRREPVDRVPIDYSANAGIDQRLKAHFGLGERDGEGLLQALGVDFRGIGAPYRGGRLHAERPGRNVDPQFGVVTRWVEHGNGGGYWDYCDFPLAEADADTLDRWPMPKPDDFDYSGVAQACRDRQD